MVSGFSTCIIGIFASHMGELTTQDYLDYIFFPTLLWSKQRVSRDMDEAWGQGEGKQIRQEGGKKIWQCF